MNIKRFSVLILVLALLAAPGLARAVQAYSGYPTFSIVSVKVDESVTIKTSNLPANDTFTVTMGKMGTKGIGGTVVAKTDSGSGGSQTFTYSIPEGLKGQAQIAIRMQSPTSGYYAYNWFTNSTSGATSTPVTKTPTPSSGYTGFPTFSILDVVADGSVTVVTHNLPKDDTFTVTMGAYGTKGIGGVVVAKTDSGSGGMQTLKYDIPASLKGSARIAIRMQSPSSGYFAYNWFWNKTGTGESATPTPSSGYTGFPTFSITAVDEDASVTIKTSNLPKNDTFTVTMGAYGTKGIGGVEVAKTDTGSGGSQTFTYSIPSSLKGSTRIAIRMQSATSGYFAYNWFWNNDAP